MGPRTYYEPIVQENVLVRVLACVGVYVEVGTVRWMKM